MKWQAILCVLVLAGSVSLVRSAPTTMPTSRPADRAVDKLIGQLGDADSAVREAAAARLRQMGKSVLPALKEASRSDDPEVSASAAALIKKIEKRIPDPRPTNPNMHAQTVRMSVMGGRKTLDVDENGRKIRIEEDQDGAITMTVGGVEDGKDAQVEFKAKNAEELKRDEPEAYALYEKWGGNKGPGFIIQGKVIGGGGRIQVGPNGVQADEIRLEVMRRMEQMQAEKIQADAEAARKAEEAKQRAIEEDQRRKEEQQRKEQQK